MNQQNIAHWQNKVDFLRQNRDQLVVDADTHITDTANMAAHLKKQLADNPDYYHGRPINAQDLLTEMNMAQVDICLVWQNPAATYYPGDKDGNYQALWQANHYIFEVEQRYPERFIPAGWTDPKALGITKARQLIKNCVQQFAFPIVKINPAQNEFPIDSDEVITLTADIIDQGAIPAFHFGADTPYTPAEGLEKLANQFPDSPIIAVHMAGGGAGYMEAETEYLKARDLGLKYPNIKYCLSAKRDTHIECDLINYQLAGQPFSENLFCASDAPYGRQSWNFGGYRLMFESLCNGKTHTDKRLRKTPELFDKESVINYMGRNFINLIIPVYQQLIERYD